MMVKTLGPRLYTTPRTYPGRVPGKPWVRLPADRVAEDLDDLLRRLGDGHRGSVDLLERVGQLAIVNGDDRLAEGSGVSGLERGVPLPVLVAKPHHDHVDRKRTRLNSSHVRIS